VKCKADDDWALGLELDDSLVLDVESILSKTLKETTNLWKISRNERQCLYLYWLSKHRKRLVRITV